MNLIKYAIAKIRLVLATARAKTSKDTMYRVIKGSKAATEEITENYENFLDKCRKQEKAKVQLKRIKSQNSGNTILNADLNIKHYIVSPDVSGKLTRFDIEMAVTRHRYCDWGKVSPAIWQSNNDAVTKGNGIVTSKHSLYEKGYFTVEGKVGCETVNVKEGEAA